MTKIKTVVDDYYGWLKENTTWDILDKWAEVTLPFLDRHNDFIQIYIKKTDNGFFLTDNGSTILGLQQEGCTFETTKRREILESKLNKYGVTNEGEDLIVYATSENLAVKIHFLVQAILNVNEMHILSESRVARLFHEDFRIWLNASGISFSENKFIRGHSGKRHKFDFCIEKTKNSPLRVLKTINNPALNSAYNIALFCNDIYRVNENSPDNLRVYAAINDNEKDVPRELVTKLIDSKVVPVNWTQRSEYLMEFAA